MRRQQQQRRAVGGVMQRNILHVTAIHKSDEFLLICGQHHKELVDQLRNTAHTYLPVLRRNTLIGPPKPNTIYLTDNGFRAVLIQQNSPSSAIVEYIDYGIEEEVPLRNLVDLDSRSREAIYLRGLDPLADKYLLASFRSAWSGNEIDGIRAKMLNVPFYVQKMHVAENYQLISLEIPSNNIDLQTNLVEHGFGKTVSIAEQIQCLFERSSGKMSSRFGRVISTRNLNAPRPLQMQTAIPDITKKFIVNHIGANGRPSVQHRVSLQPEQTVPSETHSSETIPVFKSNDLAMSSFHMVYCSYIQDGPALFSVQLINNESILDKMMSDLGNYPLRNLTHRPTVGMACVVRYSEDRNFYRAVIENVQPNGCRVMYVDYGNSENVEYSDIYDIPPQFLEQKVFAVQYSLHGWKKLQVADDRIKQYFANLVQDEKLELKVMPMDGMNCVQYCELFYKNSPIIDLLQSKLMEFNSFANPTQLIDNDLVQIKYVENAKRFFVQRVCDVEKFDCMMDKLLIHCRARPSIDRTPKVGLCCAATWQNDPNEWYRVRVLEFGPTGRPIVEYVDFGFKTEISIDQIKPISADFLIIPRQVNECCLVDFENVLNVPDSTRKQLEMMAEDRNRERRKLRVKLHGRTPTAAIVLNLFDDSETPPRYLSAKVYEFSMPRKPFYNNNKYTKSPENSDTVPISTTEKTLASSGTWSEITNADEQQIGPANKSNWSGSRDGNWFVAKEANKEPNKDVNWSSNRDSNSNPPRKFNDNRRGVFENRQRDSGDFEIRRTGKSDGWESKTTEIRATKPRTDNWAEADKAERASRGNYNRNNFGRENPEGAFRPQKDSSESTSTWRNDEQGVPNNRFNRSDRRTNDFNRRERFNTQKYVIPRFNRTNRQMNGTIYNMGGRDNFGKNVNGSEMVSFDAADKLESNTNPEESFKPIETEIFVPFDTALPEPLIPINARSKITLVQWISPYEFYIHLKSYESDFDIMMKQIQIFYGKRSATKVQPKTDDTIIIYDSRERVYKRGQVIDYNTQLNKYRVHMIDYGNKIICETNEIYDLEQSFVRLPPLAIWCSLRDIIMNCLPAEITITKYIDPTKKIHCDFINTADGITFVELEVNDVNLRDTFVTDGIVSLVPKDVEINQLVGQVVNLRIVFIKDLTYFRAQLFGCETIMMCCYSNVKVAKQNQALSEEFKRLYESKIMTVKVDKVTNTNILMVTPYIPILGHKRSYGPPIPHYPVLCSSFNSQIPHVDSKNEVYVQKYDTTAQLENFLGELYDFYSVRGTPLTDIRVGTLCAALSSDENFYRGQIQEINADNNILIRYIDYGNYDLIPLTNLKQLSDEHQQLSAFAIKAYLAIDCAETVNPEQLQDKVVQLTQGFQLCTSIIDYYNGYFVVDIKNNNISLSERLQQIGLAKALPLEMVRSFIDADIERQKLQLTLPSTIKAKSDSNVVTNTNQSDNGEATHLTSAHISHADQPDRFYLQFENTSDELLRFQQNLEIVAPSLPPLKDFRAGLPCIAKYSVDDQWYRARIIDTDGEITSIQFIDYGNTDSITDKSLLKTSNDSFNAIPPFAVPCSLALAPIGRDWSEAACQKIQDIGSQLIHFDVISESSERYYVNIFIDETNIAKELITSNEAIPLDILKSGEKCFVSHTNSIENFYIQMDASSTGLEIMEQFLADPAKLEPLLNVERGVICAALFSEDGCYYRARVLSKQSEDIEVMFVDFGNTSLTTDVRVLPDKIAEIPDMARKCSLKIPDAIQSWSEAAEVRFKDISATGATVFTVQLVKVTKQETIVELYVDNSSIGNQLAVLCPIRPVVEHVLDEHVLDDSAITVNKLEGTLLQQAAFITHFNSPQSFYIQLTSRSAEYNEMIERLAQANSFASLPLETANENDIYAALFYKDQTYYRCKLIGSTPTGIQVHFIDFGNEAITQELHVIPDDLKDISTFAIHSRLESKADSWGNEQVEIFKGLILPDVECYFETIDATVCPQVIRIFNADADVLDICEASSNTTSDFTETAIANASTSTLKTIRKNAFVSHVDSPQSFYVQFESQNTKINKISERLEHAETYELVEPEQISLNEIYAGIFSVDGVFYRCKVTNILSDSFGVHFIDYGNDAITQDLRLLPDDIKSIEAIAIHCQLNAKSRIWTPQQIKKFKDLTASSETTFQIEIEDTSCSPHVVNLLQSDVNIFKLCEPLDTTESTTDHSFSETSADTQESNRKNIVITHVNSPQSFYVQCENQDNEINQMLNHMAVASSYPQVDKENVSKDDIYGGLRAVDGLYYRCKVINIHAAGYEVAFIDYGNMDNIQDLRTLPEDVKALPPLALHCQLNEDSATWSPQQINAFSDLTSSNSAFQAKFVDNNQTPKVIQLFSSDTSIIDFCQSAPAVLINISAAESESTFADIQPIREEVFIPHVNSPQSLFVQLNKANAEINKMLDSMELANSYSQVSPNDANSVDIYAGLFSEDDHYYRCKVINTVANGYDVHFIDYGNNSNTQDLRILPEDVKSVSPLALHCALGNEATNWNEQQIKLFKDLTSDEENTFQAEIIDPSTSPQTIRLFKSGINITELCQVKASDSKTTVGENQPVSVREQPEKAYITNANSPNSFFIQLDRQTNELNKMVNNLVDATTYQQVNPEDADKSEIYAGLFDEDNFYYRCKVISIDGAEIKVYFIDYGNEAITKDIRQLPDALKSIEPFATHCQLGEEAATWNDEQVQHFHNTIEKDSTFLLEVTNANCSPQIVRLLQKDGNIIETTQLCVENGLLKTENDALIETSANGTSQETSSHLVESQQQVNHEVATNVYHGLVNEAHKVIEIKNANIDKTKQCLEVSNGTMLDKA